MKVKKAVIPAAGLGLRFLPITKAQPKEMLPIIDKPVIHFVVKEAVESDIKEILIITGKGKRAIEDYFDASFELERVLESKGKNKLLKEMKELANMVDIHYVRQKEQKGLADAIRYAKSFVGNEPFVVLLGDTILKTKEPCTKTLIGVFNRYGRSVIAVEKVPKEIVSRYGIIKGLKLEGSVYEIRDLIEKPEMDKAPSNLAVASRYILTPEIFDMIEKIKPGVGGELQITDAIKLLLNNQKIYAYLIDGKRYDIGSKIDYAKTMVDFALERKDFGKEFKKYLESKLVEK